MVMKKHKFSALLEDSAEVELLQAIILDQSHEVIVKNRQSTFIRTNFEENLRSKSIDTIIIGEDFILGCVRRTTIDAYERYFNEIVAKDASFSHMKFQEGAILEVIKYEQEKLIFNNKKIIEYIKNRKMLLKEKEKEIQNYGLLQQPIGASRGARTPDHWIRSPTLYPTELQMHKIFQIYYNIKVINFLVHI